MMNLYVELPQNPREVEINVEGGALPTKEFPESFKIILERLGFYPIENVTDKADLIINYWGYASLLFSFKGEKAIDEPSFVKVLDGTILRKPMSRPFDYEDYVCFTTWGEYPEVLLNKSLYVAPKWNNYAEELHWLIYNENIPTGCELYVDFEGHLADYEKSQISAELASWAVTSWDFFENKTKSKTLLRFELGTGTSHIVDTLHR